VRNAQVIRQWEMLKALQGGPKTTSQLADQAECTVRNIYRNLEALQYAGFPLFSDRDEDGITRWRLASHISVPERRVA
jgi:predicted DNA-binding transcriptional regulator YafY